jgi:hypothetical protein
MKSAFQVLGTIILSLAIMLALLIFLGPKPQLRNPAALVRARPSLNCMDTIRFAHMNGIGKNSRIHYTGVSGNKEKVTIDGKEYNEPWYFVSGKITLKSHKKQVLGLTVTVIDSYDYVSGWVQGSEINLDSDPPTYGKHLPINNTDLANMEVEYRPCKVQFINGGEHFERDCANGGGTMRFYPNGRFLRTVNGDYNTEDWSGFYEIEDNILILTFDKDYNWAHWENNQGVIHRKKTVQNILKKYNVCNLEGKPIFISLDGYPEEYICRPRPFVEDENDGFIEMAKQLNVKI